MSARIGNKFSEQFGARGKPKTQSPLLRPLTILALILIGVFSFAALIVLLGYGDDLRQKENGAATPLSRSAVGYAALVQFLDDAGFEVSTDPKPYKSSFMSRRKLRVYTPSSLYQTADLSALSDDAPKLIILPKWSVAPLEEKPGWVRESRFGSFMRAQNLSQFLGDKASGIYIGHTDEADLAGGLDLSIAGRPHNLEFGELQYFTEVRPQIAPSSEAENNEDNKDDDETDALEGLVENIEELTGITNNDPAEYESLISLREVTDKSIFVFKEKSLLIKLSGTQTYILSDPDFVNTMGLSSQSKAVAASDIFLTITQDAGLNPKTIVFDLSLHKIGGNPNLVKLMTQPPFLAATLCLIAAAFLIGWQGFVRFGDPRPAKPDYSQGPAALAQSTAAFISMARRERSMGPAYADLVRRSTARTLGLGGQSEDIIQKRLVARETLRGISPKFEDLQHISDDMDAASFTARARALNTWKEEMLREP